MKPFLGTMRFMRAEGVTDTGWPIAVSIGGLARRGS